MTDESALDDLLNAGLTVTSDSGQLILKPASRLTPDLVALAREHKPGILALLAQPEWVSALPGLIRPGLCLDCGGPAPRDGLHWCADCKRESSAKRKGIT